MVKKILARKKRLRSILSFVVAAVIIGSISYLGVKTYHDSHAATGASIYVNPGSGTLTAGSIVSITVRENSGTDPINTVQASLNYDSNSLQYSSISESGSFPVVAATTYRHTRCRSNWPGQCQQSTDWRCRSCDDKFQSHRSVRHRYDHRR